MKNRTGTKISHAAIRTEDGAIYTGRDHAQCYRKYNTRNPKVDAGFITNYGDFVSREYAAHIAFNADQIDNIPPLLFSEHLWCYQGMYKGLHDYNEKEGYILKVPEPKEPEIDYIKNQKKNYAKNLRWPKLYTIELTTSSCGYDGVYIKANAARFWAVVITIVSCVVGFLAGMYV